MEKPLILAIESSCDDTSAAVLRGRKVLSNIIASQKVHEAYGGVVPELASRAHQQNIVPVIHAAMTEAGVRNDELDAIGFTRGPGLIGSLLVGVSFAKAMALTLRIPLVEADHLEGHVLSHLIEGQHPHPPSFPFLCLTVSGGHTQIVKVNTPMEMEIIGKTIDDAAGEAFDKTAKILGLPYPGGPLIDKLAAEGDPARIALAHPRIPGLDYSFSGLKTSFLYHVRDHLKEDPEYISKNLHHLAAAMQSSITEILMQKLVLAARQTGIRDVALAGGVSANSLLRRTMSETGKRYGWRVFLPEFRYTTDNAAMIGMAAHYRFLQGMFADQDAVPYASYSNKKAGKP